MKYLDENDIRIQARVVSKQITDLGNTFGPNEAFYAGAKYTESQYVKQIEDLNHKIYLKERDLLNLIQDVYKFAGRPTKDGAKLLRESAAKLEELLTRS